MCTSPKTIPNLPPITANSLFKISAQDRDLEYFFENRKTNITFWKKQPLKSADSKQNTISKSLFQDSFRHIFWAMRKIDHTFWKKQPLTGVWKKKGECNFGIFVGFSGKMNFTNLEEFEHSVQRCALEQRRLWQMENLCQTGFLHHWQRGFMQFSHRS